MNEKRSPRGENVEVGEPMADRSAGVGARQAAPPDPTGGGGYQDVCTAPNFGPAAAKKIARDPRLDELRRMGLQRAWLNVAEAIGVDAFLAMWRILDADPSTQHNDTTLRISLRVYRSYLRFQRNRYIESLKASGLTPAEVKARLEKQLCETVSIRHIQRLGNAE